MICVVVPFRDRGLPVRRDNVDRVLQQWGGFGMAVQVVDDGLEGGPFNLFAAYNRGAAVRADVLVYASPDVLVPVRQVRKAVAVAAARPGLVVPFRQRRGLREVQSRNVRRHLMEPVDCGGVPLDMCVTAVSVVSRVSLEAVGGWDEVFQSPRWGGNAMRRAFEICCGRTCWVAGEAYQLYRGVDDAPADDDKDARRLDCYAQAYTADRVKELTAGGW